MLSVWSNSRLECDVFERQLGEIQRQGEEGKEPSAFAVASNAPVQDIPTSSTLPILYTAANPPPRPVGFQQLNSVRLMQPKRVFKRQSSAAPAMFPFLRTEYSSFQAARLVECLAGEGQPCRLLYAPRSRGDLLPRQQPRGLS